MDRGRHRALLNGFLKAGMMAVGCWLAAAAPLRAQQGSASPVPSVAVPPSTPAATASAAPDAAARKRATERMIERRQREISVNEQEAQKRIDQLPPEEREAFKRNLKLWRELSPAERENVRTEANDRTHAEVEKALQQTGLHLSKDQQEVFTLRYRQERRRLERELQEKMEAERAHRLPMLIESLRKEFTERPVAVPTPTGSAAPSPTAKPPTPSQMAKPAAPSVSVPAPPPPITHPGG